MSTTLRISLDAVIVAVTDDVPRVLTVAGPAEASFEALPSGPLDIQQHPTLERGIRAWVSAQTELHLGYLEQLYTFGDRDRGSAPGSEPSRVISTAYLALVREQAPSPELGAHWRPWYAFLPWEDWREGRPGFIDSHLAPRLRSWAGTDAVRRERIALCFGLERSPWDPERCLERYELLWEIGVVAESPAFDPASPSPHAGRAMAWDHRRMLATALGRMRGKLKYRPVVFELLPKRFTLSQLQRVVEALAGNKLHTQNFRRLVEHGGLVERTGEHEHATGGRPAALFRFRHEVLRERPAPGVHVPRAW
ncbi:MAG: hypothetical protein KDI71_21175 [Xanthomonadales bacterium]|nr:hypothetical protein [Xanthomonadales bacterium]